MADSNYAVVTTEWRGVFFGRVKSLDRENRTCVLEHARHCVYWSTSVRGVTGLAATGPDSDCRIGREFPSVDLFGVTGIFAATDTAVQQWEKSPWT